MSRKVYLAGPDVFLPDAIAMGARKKDLCAAYGFIGLFPIDNDLSALASDMPLDRAIYAANVAMIRQADFGIVNLTPFHGPSADVGTVFELGLLIGLGKPVFGYTNDPRDLIDRLRERGPLTRDEANALWRDHDNMMVEDFGNADNLMIDASLALLGAPLIRHAAPVAVRHTDLTGFEQCLKQAAAHFAAA